MEQEFSLFDYCSSTDSKENIKISYKGPVTDHVIYEISRDIRDKFSGIPRAKRKMFSVFMELAQNISFYSAERIMYADKNDRVGTIIITEFQDYYTFSCGNLVEKEHIGELVEKCEAINDLDHHGRREFKRQQRSAPSTERSKGAGIGLIQVALNAKSNLEINRQEVDDSFMFMSLSVKISKN